MDGWVKGLGWGGVVSKRFAREKAAWIFGISGKWKWEGGVFFLGTDMAFMWNFKIL